MDKQKIIDVLRAEQALTILRLTRQVIATVALITAIYAGSQGFGVLCGVSAAVAVIALTHE